MTKRAREILVKSMRRFHKREQLIQRIVQTAKCNADGIYTVHLTAEDLAILDQKAG